jgi:ELWxxDGT repeat protein
LGDRWNRGGDDRTECCGSVLQWPFGRCESRSHSLFGNKVLFSGVDAAGHIGLWITDGTAAGTSELTTANGGLTGVSDLTVFGNKALFDGGTVIS